ncbi:hypothetical protein L7F22_060529 [Adiantum nelumboides]|nr:hypothetical protein [Adiantum nelumboides]
MISLCGLVLPFGFGSALSLGIYNNFIDTDNVSFGHFLLFTGVAMAITALPVLARIVLDLKLIHTPVGIVVLAAGVGNDVVGWILLALAIALVNASSGINALYIFLVSVGWVLFLFFLVKPALYWLARRDGQPDERAHAGDDDRHHPPRLYLGFHDGHYRRACNLWCLSRRPRHPTRGRLCRGTDGKGASRTGEGCGRPAHLPLSQIEDIVSVVFLPLYFTLSGLNTNLGTLSSGLVWGYIIAICTVAFTSKFIGCAGAARLTGFSTRESAAIGALMSCKGLVELIVLNIGLNAGILNTQVFSMFVVMALVTTCATTPLTQLIYPPHHRTPFKPGSIHSRKDEQTEKGPDGAHQRTIDSVSRKRFLVVLDRFDHLPGLLSFLQLLRPSVTGGGEDSSSLRHRRPDASADKAMSTSGSSNNHSSVDADNVPVLLSQSHAPHATHIDAVRMIELTERTSAVMRVPRRTTLCAQTP